MKLILIIGSGSFIGGICRYLLSQLIETRFLTLFPFGTLLVNLIGSFLIGLIFAFMDKTALPQEWRLFLIIGLFGGFTTFSAFSMETVSMLKEGHFLYAFSYIFASVILGIFTAFLGISIPRFL
jgi:fluoride exporter